jgi:importin subunit alpha-1
VNADDPPPYQAALKAGVIPLLAGALQPLQAGTSALEAVFEASWALTNLAVGDTDIVKAVVPLAPILIAHVGGESGLSIAEQCAWALGNIAGEDAEYRSILISNGALEPLTSLFIKCSKAARQRIEEDSQKLGLENSSVSAASTALWALTNIVRNLEDTYTHVGEVMKSEGIDETLVWCLTQDAPEPIALEASWFLALTTSGPELYVHRLLNAGLLPPLCKRLQTQVDVALINSGLYPSPLSHPSAVLSPLLRCLGNTMACGSEQVTDYFFPEKSSSVLNATVLCAESHHHRLQQEAAWVLGNVAGIPGRQGVDALKSSHAIPVLMSLLKHQPFQVRKEAAFALMNVAAGGGNGEGDLEALNYLFGSDIDAVKAMVSLMRSSDMSVARLGLQFVDTLCRSLPNGVREVEAADGIDALEALRFEPSAPRELQNAAAMIVDQYWGAEAGDKGS